MNSRTFPELGAAPLFRSKWSPPGPLAHPFRRERLHQLLNAAWKCKLTVVAAPSGYGKTSLLQMWAAEQPHPIGWLRLDAADNELKRFLLYFVQACPVLADDAERDKYSAWLEAMDAERLTAGLEAFAAHWIAVLERTERQFMIVLDGFEAITDPDIVRFLTLLLRFGPLHLHVVLSGRRVPEAGFPRAEEGGSQVLRAEDLALTGKELQLYVLSQSGVRLRETEMRELAARALGWFVGVNAYLPLIREQSYVDSEPACHSRVDQAIAACFRSLLSEAPPSLLPALTRFAMADRPLDDTLPAMSGGGSEPEPSLAELSRQGWFVFACGDRPGQYTLHPMFASVLRRELQERDAHTYAAVLRENARRAEEEGRYVHAAEHEWAGGNRERAAGILLQYAHEVLREGQLLPLLERFTEAEFERWPGLLFMYAELLIHARRIHAAEHAADRLAAIIAADPNVKLPSTDEPLCGYLSALRSMIHFSKGEAELGIAYMERTARELEGPGRLHRHSVFLHPYTASILRGKFAHYGVLPSALATFEYCLPRWGRQDTSFAVIRIGLGECYYEQGRLDLAEEQLRQGLTLGLDLNDPGLFVPAYVAWAQLKWRKGEKEAAWTALQEARNQLMERKLGERLAVVDACEVKLRIREQDVRHVRKWAAAPAIEAVSPIPYERMYEAFALLRAYLFLGRLAEALALAEKLLHAALTANHPRDLIEIHLILAHIHRKQGDTGQALEKLSRSLSEALSQGYVQMVVDDCEALTDLLQQFRKDCRAAKQTELARFANVILKAVPRDDLFEAETAPSAAADSLTRQEHRVYRLLAKGASNRTIADALSISVETVKKHCRHIYRKLGVANRKQAVRQYSRPGQSKTLE
ncbi:hypothetical protein B1A99_28335 [Cohnella sp. CIP 111063]|uniref:LuxR C-terminal-related transcriptional regulator n=1 Tax=unclassified Cohnella TaxID=2636738 RepID=UPI000B8BBD55|nr:MULTISPECIES: LuxR C-terminal-related transcriptional regulator [unclassified Cohnella]OXS53812.1 hypothetical protein B1A99_28335 [Cohnella sp. CIP 111063]PRX62390.1 ATP/maltotriose-dependent transcriptional regulator MalT [Cohnella sp. SGD-V74]